MVREYERRVLCAWCNRHAATIRHGGTCGRYQCVNGSLRGIYATRFRRVAELLVLSLNSPQPRILRNHARSLVHEIRNVIDQEMAAYDQLPLEDDGAILQAAYGESAEEEPLVAVVEVPAPIVFEEVPLPLAPALLGELFVGVEQPFVGEKRKRTLDDDYTYVKATVKFARSPDTHAHFKPSTSAGTRVLTMTPAHALQILPHEYDPTPKWRLIGAIL